MLLSLFFVILVGIFLIGMTWMRIGLLNISGSKMTEWLQKVTNSPAKGLLAGILVTIILQSSSAVTVIAVGLVAARILTFPQTIGIILGTNIGTTITLEFLTFDLSHFILPFVFFGIICIIIPKNFFKSCGYIFIGIGMIFAAMTGFEWIAQSLKTVSFINELFVVMKENIVISFFMGISLTAIIQSSTVVTGITMSFLDSGLFSLFTGLAVMLGANIGTCITAFIASIAAGREARLTAYAHIWLNLAGAILFFPFIPQLASISSFLATSPEVQLAHASVIYNVVCSLLVLPFAQPYANFIIWLHKKK